MYRSLIVILSVWNILSNCAQANGFDDSKENIQTSVGDRSTPDPHLPGENALNIKLLHTILGHRNYDSSWMSINTPSKIYEPANIDVPANKRLDTFLSFKNYTLTDENGHSLDVSQEIVMGIRRWLVQEASCKIDYIWKKIDESYWPLWVKHGVCNSRESCSLPPGMSCQPNGLKKLNLLKWTCSSDPFGKKWNEFRDSIQEDKRKRRIRLRRHNLKKQLQKNNRGQHKGLRPKRSKRLIKRYLYKTSKYVKGFLCQWKPVEYSVYESCTCSC